MGKRNPDSQAYKDLMVKYEHKLEEFLVSPDFKNWMVEHLCHTNKWHYNNQTLKVELLPGKAAWNFPATHSWSEKGECIITLWQLKFDPDVLKAEIELNDDFGLDDFITTYPVWAKELAGKSFEKTQEFLKEQARKSFGYMREAGRLD